MEEPDEEDQLEEEVEGDESQDKSGELVDDVEETEDDPVCEPLLVILRTLGLESEEGHGAWVCDAEEAGDVGVTDAEHDEDDASNQAVAGNLTRRQRTYARSVQLRIRGSSIIFAASGGAIFPDPGGRIAAKIMKLAQSHTKFRRDKGTNALDMWVKEQGAKTIKEKEVQAQQRPAATSTGSNSQLRVVFNANEDAMVIDGWMDMEPHVGSCLFSL